MINRFVCLDVGDSWVGVAHSDGIGMCSYMYSTWKASEIVENLLEYQKKNKIIGLIIGFPISLNGNETAQTEKIKKTALQLKEKFPLLEVFFEDERLSSKFAGNIMKLTNNKISKEKEHQKAAALILENFLNRRSYDLSKEENSDKI